MCEPQRVSKIEQPLKDPKWALSDEKHGSDPVRQRAAEPKSHSILGRKNYGAYHRLQRRENGGKLERADRSTDRQAQPTQLNSARRYLRSQTSEMTDPDPRERAASLIEEVRRMVETALADPARSQEWKDFIRFALRIAESSTASLYARLQYRRYDPDGKLVDMVEPPTAEQLQEDLWSLYGHAAAFLEPGSISTSPEV